MPALLARYARPLVRAAPAARPAGHARRHAGPAVARPAHLGHRPLQLPLRLLHAEGGVRRDYPFLPRAELLTFEEIARARPHLRRARREEDPPDRRRAAAAPRLERLVEMLARLGDLDLTLTTNGSLLAKKARSLRRRPHARDGEPRLARRAIFRAMNDVDFPVAKVLEGIEAAAAAGPRADQDQHGGQARHQRGADPAMARHFQGSGHILRFIEYMDVGAPTAGGWTTWCPPRRSCGHRRANCRSSRVDPELRGEVAERWRYRDGGGEIGVISSVTQAFCRDCTRARLSTEGKLYTCLFATDGHDLRALAARRRRRRGDRNAIAAIWRHAPTAIRRSAPANTARSPRSR